MKRLTDKRTAEALKHNADGLKAKGFDVPIDDLRYIKLAEYEEKDKRGKWRQVSVQTDEFNNHLYECTLCRATDRHNINVKVPYCWYCGAKMED